MKKFKFLLLMIPFLFVNSVSADEITTYKHQAGYRTDIGELIWTGYLSGSRNLIIDDPYNSYIPQYYDWSFNANVTNGYMYNVSYELLITYPYKVTSNYFTYKKYISYIDFNNIQSNYLSQSSCQISSIDNPSDYSERFTISCKFISNSSGNYEYIHVLRINTSKTIDNLANGINIVPGFTGTTMFVDYKISSWSFETNQDSYNNQIIIQGDKEIQQNQTIIEQNNQTNENLENINDSITNSDTSSATDDVGNFFNGFETDTFGLTSIITAPLDLIGSITSSTCSPLGLEIPFIGGTLNLPCLTSIYEENFGVFLDIYQTITFGIVAYWVCVKIFNLVKDFKNPDHDEIEVLDL